MNADTKRLGVLPRHVRCSVTSPCHQTIAVSATSPHLTSHRSYSGRSPSAYSIKDASVVHSESLRCSSSANCGSPKWPTVSVHFTGHHISECRQYLASAEVRTLSRHDCGATEGRSLRPRRRSLARGCLAAAGSDKKKRKGNTALGRYRSVRFEYRYRDAP